MLRKRSYHFYFEFCFVDCSIVILNLKIQEIYWIGYLVDCSLFRENSPWEHSLNNLRKFKQINSNLLFTCGTTILGLTGNKNLSQLHIRGNLTCLIPLKKLYYCAGYHICCCHYGSKTKFITDINGYSTFFLCNHENKKQIAKPKTAKLKNKITYQLHP